MLEKVQACEVRKLSSVREGLPRWLDGVLGKALAREPGDRFSDAEALAAALERGFGSAERPRGKTPGQTSRIGSRKPRTSSEIHSEVKRTGSPVAWIERAYTRRLAGQLPAALRDLERALAVDPEGPYAESIRRKLAKLRRPGKS